MRGPGALRQRVLDGEFRLAVCVDRGGRQAFVQRCFVGAAIDGAGRGEDELPAPLRRHRLQGAEGSRDIVPVVADRIGDGGGDTIGHADPLLGEMARCALLCCDAGIHQDGDLWRVDGDPIATSSSTISHNRADA